MFDREVYVSDLLPDDSGAHVVSANAQKARRALSRLTRELDDADLTNPGVVKMLLQEVERLDEENANLKNFREKYFTADKILATTAAELTSSRKQNFSIETLSIACIAIGGAMVGFGCTLWSEKTVTAQMLVGCGFVLIVAGILVRIFGK
jgi:hypothetical protein